MSLISTAHSLYSTIRSTKHHPLLYRELLVQHNMLDSHLYFYPFIIRSLSIAQYLSTAPYFQLNITPYSTEDFWCNTGRLDVLGGLKFCTSTLSVVPVLLWVYLVGRRGASRLVTAFKVRGQQSVFSVVRLAAHAFTRVTHLLEGCRFTSKLLEV